MPLVDSLLGAIVRLDGNALVMHVGEKPYVVTGSTPLDAYRGPLSWGQVELATKRLTLEAVAGMVRQLLPPDEQQALSDFGAIEHHLEPNPKVPGRFTVIAARGGDDIWLEIRHNRPAAPKTGAEPTAQAARADQTTEPEPAPAPPQETPPVPVSVAPAVEQMTIERAAEELAVESGVAETGAGEGVAVEPLPAEPVWIEPEVTAPVPAAVEPAVEEVAVEPAVEEAAVEPAVEEAVPVEPAAEEAVAVEPAMAEAVAIAPVAIEEPAVAEPVASEAAVVEPLPTEPVWIEPEVVTPVPVAVEPAVEEVAVEPAVEEAVAIEPVAIEPVVAETVAGEVAAVEPPPPTPPAEPVWIEPEAAAPIPAWVEPAAEEVAVEPTMAGPLEPVPLPTIEEFTAAIVVPLARPAMRVDVSPGEPAVHRTPLDRLLRLAAARGASALYIVTQSPPAIRVDGEITVLESEGLLGSADVAAMLMQPAPVETREAPQHGAEGEWIADVPGVGRVRCLSFRDHRGPGGIFRMLPARALSVEQLGLSRAIQALSAESEGLVLVTGPRASGKQTLISAFVDLVNRTRADHVITLESQILFVHESRRSFVSQRELRGTSQELAAAARAALRENPDVLVIDDLRSPELISVALQAAELGLLVFAALPAPGTRAAIERVIDQFAPERRAQVQTTLAGALRGVVAQVLVRKIGGGRLAAREVLINTRAVAAFIAEGRTFELPLAIEGGRRLGMVPLNDALIDAVRSGAVDPSEAYRRTHDHEGLLDRLRREGIDTSFVERLA